MARPCSVTLESIKTLFEAKRGKVLPLPPNLARLYGCLRMPLARSHPHVFSNFVTTLDGVVSLNTKGHASGGDISGFSGPANSFGTYDYLGRQLFVAFTAKF